MPRCRKDRHGGSVTSEDHGRAGGRPVRHRRGKAQLGQVREQGGFRSRWLSPLPRWSTADRLVQRSPVTRGSTLPAVVADQFLAGAGRLRNGWHRAKSGLRQRRGRCWFNLNRSSITRARTRHQPRLPTAKPGRGRPPPRHDRHNSSVGPVGAPARRARGGDPRRCRPPDAPEALGERVPPLPADAHPGFPDRRRRRRRRGTPAVRRCASTRPQQPHWPPDSLLSGRGGDPSVTPVSSARTRRYGRGPRSHSAACAAPRRSRAVGRSLPGNRDVSPSIPH